MTNEDVQKFGKDNMDMALNSFGAWTKGAQALTLEVVDYSRKSAEASIAAWEKLVGARSLEKAIEVQTEYVRSAYEDFVAQATKFGELYADFAKDAYKPFESTLGKASPVK